METNEIELYSSENLLQLAIQKQVIEKKWVQLEVYQ